MGKIRASLRSGRAGKRGVYNANHNTKEATRAQEDHIDHERTKKNVCVAFDVNGQVIKRGSFDAREHELQIYKEMYGEGLEAKNERYRKKGAHNRIRTIEEVYKSAKTAPQEIILQIGKRDTADPKDLAQVALELLREMRAKQGYVPLDLALHLDETSPHIHIRGTYKAKDSYGYYQPNQTKALEAMGYGLPDPTKPRGRYNNALISFTDDLRQKFYDRCEELGYQIEREPETPGRRHTEAEVFRLKQEIQEAKLEAGMAREEADMARTAADAAVRRQKAAERAEAAAREEIAIARKEADSARKEAAMAKESAAAARAEVAAAKEEKQSLLQEIERLRLKIEKCFKYALEIFENLPKKGFFKHQDKGYFNIAIDDYQRLGTTIRKLEQEVLEKEPYTSKDIENAKKTMEIAEQKAAQADRAIRQAEERELQMAQEVEQRARDIAVKLVAEHSPETIRNYNKVKAAEQQHKRDQEMIRELRARNVELEHQLHPDLGHSFRHH